MLSRHFFDDSFYHFDNLDRRVMREFDREFDRAFDRAFDRRLGLFDAPEFRDLRHLEDRLLRHEQEVLALRDNDFVPEADENSYVHLNYEVNNNGHVWKKTMDKVPGKNWETHISEYDMGKKALKNDDAKRLEDRQDGMAIENDKHEEKASKKSSVRNSPKTSPRLSSKSSLKASPKSSVKNSHFN